jgi:hypothetical protein
VCGNGFLFVENPLAEAEDGGQAIRVVGVDLKEPQGEAGVPMLVCKLREASDCRCPVVATIPRAADQARVEVLEASTAVGRLHLPLPTSH